MIEKGRNGDFVGGVERGGKSATFFQGFTSETETGEAASGGFFEIETVEFGPVESDLIRFHTIGVGKRVLNGHAHIRRGELREDGAIDEFDERVDDGLRMKDDVDLLGTHVEEPVGFDDFEPFVHHGGGINGDAVAHFPVGMCEGLVDGDVGELREWRFAERATGGGEDDATNFGIESRGAWRVTSGARRGGVLRR